MGKYEKRRYFRKMRKAGIPFILAAKLSRFGSSASAVYVNGGIEGFSTEVITSCTCCGPSILRVTDQKSKKSYDFCYWTMAPK